MKSSRFVVRMGAAVGIFGGGAAGAPLAFVEATVVNQAAQGLAAADLDGDGDMDIVAALANSGVDWYENDGMPTPSFVPRFIAGAAQPWAVVAVDVTHDGNIDVVSASETRSRKLALPRRRSRSWT